MDMYAESKQFGDDIVHECMRLVNPKLLDMTEVISWRMNDGNPWIIGDLPLTRHVIYWKVSNFYNWLIKWGFRERKSIVVDIKIDHKTGELKFKGTHHSKKNRISLHASEHLADPDSMIRVGKMISRCVTGKG